MTSKVAQKRKDDETRRLRRKNRIKWGLIIAGALIAISGLVVKEIFLDVLKTTSDNIEARVTALGSHYPVLSVTGSLMPVQQNLVKAKAKLEDLKHSKDISQITLTAEDINLTQAYTGAEQQFALISDIQDALPRQSDELRRQRDMFRRQLDEIRGKMQSIKADRASYVSAPSSVYFNLLTGEVVVLSVQVAWMDWQGSVVTCAEQEKKALDYNFHVWQLIMVGLFVVGVIVGIVGQRYGARTGSGE